MKISLFFTVFALILTSCSSVKRTKYSDKNMRIMVDPQSLNSSNLMKLQTSLVSTDKWTVIDRHLGFEAIKKEQERLHRYESDRYDPKNKFAHWGKMYGVGAVVTASVECRSERSFWNNTQMIKVCKQYLNLVDANTGEIVLGVSHEEESSSYQSYPEWDEVVAKMSEVYPKYFTKKKIHERLKRYQQQSLEHSQQQIVTQNTYGNSQPVITEGFKYYISDTDRQYAQDANADMMQGHKQMEQDLDEEVKKQGLEIIVEKP